MFLQIEPLAKLQDQVRMQAGLPGESCLGGWESPQLRRPLGRGQILSCSQGLRTWPRWPLERLLLPLILGGSPSCAAFSFALSWIMMTVAWSVAHKEARGFESFGHFLQGWKGRCVEPCTWAPSIELPSHTAPVCPLASQLTTSAVAQVRELQWVPLLSAQRIHDRGDTEGRWEGLICYWSSICGRRS